MTAELLLQALQIVWRTLQSLKIPAAVMGGIAMSTWKYVRATRDVDLLVGVNIKQIDTLLDIIQQSGIRLKRYPPVLSVGQLNIIQLLYEPPDAFLDMQVDLLLAESAYLGTALERSVPVKLPNVDMTIKVLTCEDLMLHKLMAGRLIDRADVVALLRLNYQALDYTYLTRWIKELNLSKEFAPLWQEALPDEPLPKV
jgi:hypothetical protein